MFPLVDSVDHLAWVQALTDVCYQGHCRMHVGYMSNVGSIIIYGHGRGDVTGSELPHGDTITLTTVTSLLMRLHRMVIIVAVLDL